MSRPASEIVEHLGAEGLVRVLDDVLDQADLVRLANSCGLEYRGMRTQSQRRERLLADLADKAQKDHAARTAIVRALRKATAPAAREWGEASAEEKTRRLEDDAFLKRDGNLGLHLFLLSDAEDPADPASHVMAGRQLLRLTSTGLPSASAASAPSREESRLRKRVAELDKKVRHLEVQLAKSRESQRDFKKDVILRKGELAESRMLAERLRKELAAAQAAAEAATRRPERSVADERDPGELARVVRKLAAEQKRFVHLIEKQLGAATGPADAAAFGDVREQLRALRAEQTTERDEARRQDEERARQLEELRVELRALQSSLPVATRGARRSRTRGKSDRVGVFIDVQNVHYSARQLKGKLDFDALMEAAVAGRRLIQATAYVVESKETDQSLFIAMLQKRAIEVRRKPLQVRADGSMKGDWDMDLALDILDAAPRLDVVVLVSGDGDFTSLVKRVKRIGPRVEVIAFPRNTAKALVEAADRYQPLDRKFMIYARTGRDASVREVVGGPGGTRPAAPAPGAPRRAGSPEAAADKPAPAAAEAPAAGASAEQTPSGRDEKDDKPRARAG